MRSDSAVAGPCITYPSPLDGGRKEVLLPFPSAWVSLLRWVCPEVKPQKNKERPLNVGGKNWKRFLNLEIYRHKKGCRDKNIEGSQGQPVFKEEQEKGKWLKDTLTKTEDQRPRIRSTLCPVDPEDSGMGRSTFWCV